MLLRRFLTVTALCSLVCSTAAGDETATSEVVDYLSDVRPILKSRCFSCHGALKQESSLRLDTGALTRKGGDGGAAVISGKPSDSPLIQRVTEVDDALRMPPEGEPLSAEQILILTRWIDQGAVSPADEQPEEDPRQHWAFQKPVRPAVPQTKDSEWVQNPIDSFIAFRHEEHGLTPLSIAKKHVLMRRVVLDLTGLPPSRDEQQEFLTDDSPDAYERLVDRLLDSPEYGERWGRHWMDVWRYSDWYGRRKVPDTLNSYGQIWRWRDWIVRSLNDDKGYDRMVMEMLAADELAPGDDENVVATGFIVRNFYRWNYNTWMKDSVEHTGKAFLGLTLNCCHCHDHKYDPITQEEYFRFRAFFEPIEIRHDRVPGEPDPGVYPKYKYGASYKPITSGMVRIVDEKLDAQTFMYTGGEARNVIPDRPPVSAGGPAILGGDKLTVQRVDLAPEGWYPGLKASIRAEEIKQRQDGLAAVQITLAKAESLVAQAEKAVTEARSTESSEKSDSESTANPNAIAIAEAAMKAASLTLAVDTANVRRAKAELAAINARIHADDVRYLGIAGNADEASKAATHAERQVRLDTTHLELARAERELNTATVKAATDVKAKPEIAKADQRIQKAKAAVAAAEIAYKTVSTVYSAIGHQYPQQSTGRRTALAKWIANPNNPLTARVAVNHIWLRHFGRAIVESTENLGRNGSRPTHPKLIDWLAVELMENSWSMKHIHRLIVTSRTYCTSSPSRKSMPEAAESATRDRDNRFLWRFDSARIDAEVVRDSILKVAGSLDDRIGGKELAQNLGLTTPRRSVYFEHHGEGRMPFLDLFDAADPCDCYRRSVSVRPQQALAMSNSELVIQQGRLLARSLTLEIPTGEHPSRFVEAAFLQILSRKPNQNESLASETFLQNQTELYDSTTAQVLATTSKDDPSPPSVNPIIRARESFIQALLSHNDFVTVR